MANNKKRGLSSKNSTLKSNSKRKKEDCEIKAVLKQEKPWYHVFTKGDPVYDEYMRTEWSFEKRTDVELFEKLSLEGAQSGLSWKTILNKRDAYRQTFHNFDLKKVAKMKSTDVDEIVNTTRTGNDVVVKHRGKIESVIQNAKVILEIQNEKKNTVTAFSDLLWSFVEDGKPILNTWKNLSEMPSKTVESESMSKALKKIGFKFVGPTTCYSLMQSCGFVIDHPKNSSEWREAYSRLQQRSGGFTKRGI